MSGFDVKVDGGPEIASALKQAGRHLERVLRDAIAEESKLCETDAKKNLRAAGTVDTNRLGSSINVQTIGDGLSADVGSNVEYAAAVEFGSAPHWAPIGPLLDWARRKLGDEGAAYAVQNAIAERGTPAQPYLTPAKENVAQRLPDTVAKHVRKVTGG